MSNVLRGVITNPDTIYGKSAYEIAVMHGFDGTEEEWLEYMTNIAAGKVEDKKAEAIKSIEGLVTESENNANRADNASASASASEQNVENMLADAEETFENAKNNALIDAQAAIDAAEQSAVSHIESIAESAFSVVQTAGDSETSVMSQKATSALFMDGMTILDGEDPYWYINHSTGEAVKSGAYFRLYLFLNPTFKFINAFVAATNTTPAAIAFYADYDHESEAFDGSFINAEYFMADKSVQFKASSTNGNWHGAFVPEGCKAVVVCTRTDASGFEPKILVDPANVLSAKIEGLQAPTVQGSNCVPNPFTNRKFYSHLFIDKTSADSDIVIPCQSVYDIDAASRLGFTVVEGNVNRTSDGKYVVMHGASGGYLGAQVVAVGDGIADPTTVKFSELTYAEIRNNYVYRSKYAKYRTKITSLEEFLLECKKRSIIPFVEYIDDEMLRITKSIVGNDFILYNGSREKFDGMIYRWGSSTATKDDILAVVDSIGAPMMYGVNGVGRFTDEELTEIVSAVHKRGCLIGWAGCYGNTNSNNRMFNLGLDFSGSAWDVDDFESGNLLNAKGDVDFSDFVTSGTVNDGVLTLARGNTISVANLNPQFLAKGVLKIMFKGTINIGMGYKYQHDRAFTSDGTTLLQFGTYFMEEAPTFTVRATAETTITKVDYKVSKC